MRASEYLQKLSNAFQELPGVGRRSAGRMSRALVTGDESVCSELLAALEDVRQNLCCCSECGNLTLASDDPCRLCTDPERDSGCLCVVEDPGDIAAIEHSGAYRGRYHALMGKLSPMRGEGPRNMRLKKLIERINAGNVTEVILALNSDVQGDATASFIMDMLKDRNVRISRPAMGLPAGGGISYCDDLTLTRAMNARQTV